MTDIQEITLDIHNHKTYEQLYQKQFNTGTTLKFNITRDGVPYDISGISALFQMKKPDGTIVIDTCQVSGNTISITVTEQMTSAPGNALFQITMKQGDVVISTITAKMRIDEGAVNPNDPESKSEFNFIIEAWVETTEAAKQAKISEQNAKQSEINANNSETLSRQWAVGDAKETPTIPSDTNNSYYYSERSRIYMDTKADQTTVDGCINKIEFNEDNGVFTIYFVNGTTATIDTNIEKIAVNFDYDAVNEKLILYGHKGEIIAEIDLSSLISEYDIQGSSTISVGEETVGKEKHYTISLIKNSVTEEYLDVTFVSEMRENVRITNENTELTEQYRDEAKQYSELASASELIAVTKAEESKASAEEAKSSEDSAKESEIITTQNKFDTLDYRDEVQRLYDLLSSALEGGIEEIEWNYNIETGNLEYNGGRFTWIVNDDGELLWEVSQ